MKIMRVVGGIVTQQEMHPWQLEALTDVQLEGLLTLNVEHEYYEACAVIKSKLDGINKLKEVANMRQESLWV